VVLSVEVVKNRSLVIGLIFSTSESCALHPAWYSLQEGISCRQKNYHRAGADQPLSERWISALFGFWSTTLKIGTVEGGLSLLRSSLQEQAELAH
jgi:hypothetical protein